MVMYQDAQATGAEQTGRIFLAPYVLLRVTGLPFSTVDQMPFPRTFSLVDELIQIEDWQQAHEEKLQEALRECLRGSATKEIQHRGLDLRRALKARNAQKSLALHQHLRSHLPQVLNEEIDRWCQQSARRAAVLEAGEPTVQEESCKNRAVLHRLFRDEAFQHGL